MTTTASSGPPPRPSIKVDADEAAIYLLVLYVRQEKNAFVPRFIGGGIHRSYEEASAAWGLRLGAAEHPKAKEGYRSAELLPDRSDATALLRQWGDDALREKLGQPSWEKDCRFAVLRTQFFG